MSTQALAQMAAAVHQFEAAAEAAAASDLEPGHAAYAALLVEHMNVQLSRAQVYAAHAVRRTGAHKLDRPSLQAIGDLPAAPSVGQIQAAAGRTTAGRTHFKTANDLFTGWLHLPASTVRDRMTLADCLVGGVDAAGRPTRPLFPALAEEFAGGLTQDAPEDFEAPIDPRLVAAAARKLHTARKDLNEQSSDQAQAASVHFMRSDPQNARRHINNMVRDLKAGKRTAKALLAEIGLFKLGEKNGLVRYLLRVLPSQAARIEEIADGLANPHTEAGNPEALHERAAKEEADLRAERGEDPQDEWDNPQTQPEWSKEPQPDPPTSDLPEDGEPEVGYSEDDRSEDEISDEHPEDDATGENSSRSAGEKPHEPPHAWDDLHPERRRLMALMAALTSSGPPGLKTPNVAMIISYEKLMAQAKDAGITASGPLTLAEIRAALCCGGIYPVVLNGQGLPLDLGRTQRLYSKAQTRALQAAYRGCAYPGCSMPAHRCEVDHLDPWASGGETNISTADLYCTVHHISRHAGLFRAVKIPGARPMVLLAPELDPEQRLRYNTYFMSPAEAMDADRRAAQLTEQWRSGLQLEFAAV